MDELPACGCILFSNDFTVGHAAVTWSYEEERIVTHIKTTPIPFNLPKALQSQHTNEHFTVSSLPSFKIHNFYTPFIPNIIVFSQVPCKLQYWETLSSEFVDYNNFELSEHVSKQVQLPKVSNETKSRLVASHIWRVFIGRPDVTVTPLDE